MGQCVSYLVVVFYSKQLLKPSIPNVNVFVSRTVPLSLDIATTTEQTTGPVDMDAGAPPYFQTEMMPDRVLLSDTR